MLIGIENISRIVRKISRCYSSYTIASSLYYYQLTSPVNDVTCTESRACISCLVDIELLNRKSRELP